MYDMDKYAQAYTDSAQEKVTDEQVLGAWLFYRSGGFAAMGVSKLSPLAATALRTVNKKRAGGFPNIFLVAVTPTTVRAFRAKQRRNGVKLGDELGVWDRTALKVTVREAAVNTEVIFESPDEGEKVTCSTGKDAHSKAFLELLQAHPAPA